MDNLIYVFKGFKLLDKAFKIVDLPAPFKPQSVVIFPIGKLIFKSLTIILFLYFNVKFLVLRSINPSSLTKKIKNGTPINDNIILTGTSLFGNITLPMVSDIIIKVKPKNMEAIVIYL